MCVLLSMRRCILLVAVRRTVSATSSLQYGDATGVDDSVKGTMDRLSNDDGAPRMFGARASSRANLCRGPDAGR
jgi:hypothetical protein